MVGEESGTPAAAKTPALFDLTGRTALVTGASRGIGRVVATALAAAGASVALVARNRDGLADTARAVTVLGREAVVIPADLTAPEAASGAVAAAIDRLGHLDIVVNNAGGSGFLAPFLDTRAAGWHKTIRLNLDAAAYVCHAVGAHLLARGTGSVVNVGSVLGLGGAVGLAPYGAAKGAIIALTKTLAVEWAEAGVRVNALCPGWTATDLTASLRANEHTRTATVAHVPMGRWAVAEEMAGPALFLASDASSYMTGHVLVVDGGQSALL